MKSHAGKQSHLQKTGRTNQLTNYIPMLRFAKIVRLGARKEFFYRCVLAGVLEWFFFFFFVSAA